ncbi:MAG: M24 family metallopeptidase [Parvibaculaceae bacterium]
MTNEDEYKARTIALQSGLAEANIDLAILTDPDSIIYFAGYWNYLGVELGRPTLVLVPRSGEPTIITPLMESEMCRVMSWIGDVRPWADGIDGEWAGTLERYIAKARFGSVGFEKRTIHPSIALRLKPLIEKHRRADLHPITTQIRVRKSASEIEIMRAAGKVAVAMLEGARSAIGIGVPEYEVALAAIAGGTRKAATLLEDPRHRFVSPTIYNLQIMQSGRDTCMVHRRSATKRIEKGDPIYLCFCGVANFHNYKLGFDREFYVGSITDEQARVQEAAVKAQQTALAAIKPGAVCEDVNHAAEEVYKEAGFGPSYRTGRSIGCSFIEPPELKRGDKTVLEAGMTFAVDGGITVEGKFGGRIGDSIVVTDKGFEYFTQYPRELTVL